MLNGAAYSLPFHRALSSGPARASRCAAASVTPAGSSESGSAQPASANSAVHTTSIPIRSRVRSLPVSRRASCNRCSSARFGRLTCRMVNRPPSSLLHRCAAAENVAASLAGV
ncbi:Uncharacterised protein [Mycobacteroides abscessus subsp. abscessus]|nr:Uncharacterised protein [Mycobacteroides abscessus subsp. abscessus]SKW72956.1 Uncharacterised protein [Mycobacteroides abscessus subsp. abscessus]